MTITAMTVLCVDFYEQQGLVLVGGNSVNFATQCRQNGVSDVALIGAIGDDTYGKDILAYVDKRGIDRSHVQVLPGKTASNRILINEQGDRYFPPNAWDGGVYQDFRLTEADWEFALSRDLIAIPANNINFQESLQRKTPHNVLACDFLDLRDFDLMEQTIPRMDLAFISGDEAMLQLAQRLSRTCSTIITVTLGAQGSVSWHRGQRIAVPAVAVAEVKDTTGCGDAYQAAFCVSFYQNRDIQAAMQAGSAAAAAILSHIGAVS